MSAVQQRHLADEAQGVLTLVVIPAAVEQHHTVLVLVPTLVVVGLTTVPITVGQLAPWNTTKTVTYPPNLNILKINIHA